MIVALAFVASFIVGICGLAAVSLCVMSSRRSRQEERLVDTRPFDDRRPEERR